MTIGLYDIDFLHDISFSLSLPLMKCYNYFYSKGHQVIMMKPFEDTGRYTKILYFKDSPKLAVPKSLKIDMDKGKMLGYGFFKKSNLTNPSIIAAAPSFFPYEIMPEKIKNKRLFKKVSTNSIVDWREKDFTGVRTGAGTTYINDRDFLEEPDWEEAFKYFDNNISFTHTIWCKDKEIALKFLNKNYQQECQTVVPILFDEDYVSQLPSYSRVYVDNLKTPDDLFFLFIFALKIWGGGDIVYFTNGFSSKFSQLVYKWYLSRKQISFKEFLQDDWKEEKYYNFRYRILLKQDPKKITYK